MKTATQIAAKLALAFLLASWAVAQAPAGQPATTAVAATPSVCPEPVKDKSDFNAHAVEISLASLAVLAAWIGLFFYHKQARAATQEHKNNVHQLIFERLDSSEIRAARHYIYSLDTEAIEGKLLDFPPGQTEGFTFQKEHWLSMATPGFGEGTAEERKSWQEHKDMAERVARALDQLGYLVREGIVPLTLVARFYTYPTLKCWYKLCPYIAAVRHDRKQLGHYWEWENLVNKIIDGAMGGEGIWKGTRDHDNLGMYAAMIRERMNPKTFPSDKNWKPPDHSG